MFEYLMPLLVMRSPAASLLERTADLVVARQIDYGNQLTSRGDLGVRITRDMDLTYQYSQFGVPGLGIVRGPRRRRGRRSMRDRTGPMVAPGEVRQRTIASSHGSAPRRYGFYEAIDFTAPALA